MDELKQLKEQMKELDMIFQLSHDEIFVTDGEGYCVRVNPVCQKHYGLHETDMVGKHVTELVEQGLFNPSSTLKVLKEKKQVTMIQSTSTGIKLHVTSTPVFDESGNLIRVISNSLDITDIVSLQAQIRNLEEMIDHSHFELEKLRYEKKTYGKLVVKSIAMKKVFQMLERIAKVDSTVLLLGESGVGKTEIARWIHQNSRRHKHAFVEINCGAIPPNLFESELFGYEPGSFTGALRAGQQGLLESAHLGTLFLDEIGELPLELQTKILQVIQDKSFLRIGGRERKTVDVRIIAATNRDLERMVQQKQFRQDLYYRLSVVPIRIPSLRDRRDDLIELIYTLLSQVNQQYEMNKVLSSNAMEYLLTYHWPGNVRELQNTIERLAVTSEGNLITLNSSDISLPEQNEKTLELDQLMEEDGLNLREVLESVEKKIIKTYIQKYKSTRKVAALLQTSQSSISRKCLKYGISNQI
ncbi:PAS domain S-box-containing protein [Seinonella peptonophila]|uniref:HTH-type transcriptional regulatory protein TyrR n=1 Tax=Seinonella peptonophila TaxID=112248 RepID=A0A1M4V3I5_9BACL|nr:sigma 54-interacting transcriptional regulator [Seinonella peptonophila]SHE63551.1 PAS domain S-box-containing protein [Seinonella peptonophila]